MPTNGVAGDSYGPLIETQLNYERAIKGSFEQRALGVVTTSGVLVSLLFGLAAIVTQAEGFKAPPAARVLLVIALGLFLVAAGLSIRVNMPRGYKEADVAKLRRLTEAEFWEARSEIGARRAAELRVNVLASTRLANGRKAKTLFWAMVLEVAAIAVVGAAVVVVLVAD